jgi:hypothetical protein
VDDSTRNTILDLNSVLKNAVGKPGSDSICLCLSASEWIGIDSPLSDADFLIVMEGHSVRAFSGNGNKVSLARPVINFENFRSFMVRIADTHLTGRHRYHSHAEII